MSDKLPNSTGSSIYPLKKDFMKIGMVAHTLTCDTWGLGAGTSEFNARLDCIIIACLNKQ